ncbi:MAG: CDP-glycerol--glycerophosphate glycerophosphotransferase, partial [Clostridia bacterium]|nr:CDP-glycerol--glycerophosphate glycerophosphotransferase [Clostridia bacterium]
MLSYIDPGTGSMLFTVLIGILGAAVYSVRVFILKMKSRIGGGKAKKGARVPLAVFSDNKRYFTVFDPVLRELSARGQPVLYLTASEDDPALGCGYEGLTAEYIGPGNRVFTRLNSLDATVV